MSIILKGKITYDYLITGSVVSLIVAALVILLIQHIRKMEKRTKEALKRANNELEKRVQQRTTELETSNVQLNREVEERKIAQREAEAANSAKSDFLANMSHELRTPLNHIIGFTQMLVDQHFGELNEDQETYLGNVLQSSEHLLSLVDDILDLSKVEAGKLELEISDVDIKKILESSLIMVKEKAVKHRIRLKLSADNLPNTIKADERKIKQILYNLLSNSVKFTPDGGKILLTVKNSAHSPETNDGSAILITLTDTGIGIDSEDLDRIFEAFEQVDGSMNRKYQGTGLGLSLTKRLVELHGGRIWVESAGKNKGSKFSFVIPY
jgi:signal transduction histidine kinase